MRGCWRCARRCARPLNSASPRPAGSSEAAAVRLAAPRGDMETWRTVSRTSSWTCSPRAPRACAWPPTSSAVLLSELAYTLFEGLRRFALGDTDLETASPDRIRLTSLRIGAVVLRNTRRIRFLLSSTVSVAPTPPGFQCEGGVKAQGSSWSICAAGCPAAMASRVALR